MAEDKSYLSRSNTARRWPGSWTRRSRDYQVTTDTFLQIAPKIRPSLADEVIEEFRKDSITYSRT
jgi:hypothetical protein